MNCINCKEAMEIEEQFDENNQVCQIWICEHCGYQCRAWFELQNPTEIVWIDKEHNEVK
jgi:hypothetical protein